MIVRGNSHVTPAFRFPTWLGHLNGSTPARATEPNALLLHDDAANHVPCDLPYPPALAISAAQTEARNSRFVDDPAAWRNRILRCKYDHLQALREAGVAGRQLELFDA